MKTYKYTSSLLILFLLFACGPSLQDAKDAGFNSLDNYIIANEKGFETHGDLKKKTGWDNFNQWQEHYKAGYLSRNEFTSKTSYNSLSQMKSYKEAGFETMEDFKKTGFGDLNIYKTYKEAGFETMEVFFKETGFGDLDNYLKAKEKGYETLDELINKTGWSNFKLWQDYNNAGFSTRDAFNKTGFRNLDQFNKLRRYGYSVKQIKNNAVDYSTFKKCWYGDLDWKYACEDDIAVVDIDGYGIRSQRWLEDYNTYEYKLVKSCSEVKKGRERYSGGRGIRLDQKDERNRIQFEGCRTVVLKIGSKNFSSPDIIIIDTL